MESESITPTDLQLLESAVLTSDPEAIEAYRARVAAMGLAEYEAMRDSWKDYAAMEKIMALPDYAEVLADAKQGEYNFNNTMKVIGYPAPDTTEAHIFQRVLDMYRKRTAFPERVIALMQVIEWEHPDIELSGDDADDEDGPDEISRMSYSDVCLELLSLPEIEWWLAVLLYQQSRFNYDQVWTCEQAGEALRSYLLEYVPAQA
jgi:hypothetical protein